MLIEMNEQEAKDFAAWLRERGNSYLQRAARIEHGKSLNGSGASKDDIQPALVSVTQEQFEKSAIKKSGRIYDLARRLHVEESVIQGFLGQPNAKVSVQERGWIKPKPAFTG
jgi:hypothetical protein